MFNHIYIEEDALDYPLTKGICERFTSSQRIIIPHYKDLFNRSNQDWREQKRDQKLILAKKKDGFLYNGSEMTPAFGNTHFYYNGVILNCIYDCDYCYLQRMFPSAHVVIFVNHDDFAQAVHHESARINKPIYLAVSYDSDLLAFDKITGYSKLWIQEVYKNNNLTIELRTKSANYKTISVLKPSERVILAWSVSPESIIANYEPKTARLHQRIEMINRALSDGWPVRLCIDPVLYSDNWESVYRDFIHELAEKINLGRIKNINVGVFRMPHDFLKCIKKQRKDSAILFDDYQSQNGVLSYPNEIKEEIQSLLKIELAKVTDSAKIDWI